MRGVGLGDEWAVIAGRDGLYYFDGTSITDQNKLSTEIQPTWDAINWQYGYLINVKVDITAKRIYVAVPMGTSAVPNQILVIDYTEGFGDPRAPYASGAPNDGIGRKWCPWLIPSNSMDQILRNDGTQQLFIGDNTGTGKIYNLDSGATDDDGAAIDSYYQTAFFQQETRLNFGYVTANITGQGFCNLILRKGSQNYLRQIRGWTLRPTGFFNMERQIQLDDERMAIRLETNAPGHHFSLQSLNMYVQESAYTNVRGINQ